MNNPDYTVDCVTIPASLYEALMACDLRETVLFTCHGCMEITKTEPYAAKKLVRMNETIIEPLRNLRDELEAYRRHDEAGDKG